MVRGTCYTCAHAEAHTLYRAALDINDEELSGSEHAELECAALSALANTYKDAQQWEDAGEL